MSDADAAVLNGLLLVGGASLGYALHSSISTGEFSALFVTGLGSLVVWLAIRETGDETAAGAMGVDE